jgi:hypothetical protein
MIEYVVEIKKTVIGILIPVYIHRVVSYKKGLDGVIVSLNIEKAHKYKSEKNALKAANFYNGVVSII